jgi:hypothetical protein
VRAQPPHQNFSLASLLLLAIKRCTKTNASAHTAPIADVFKQMSFLGQQGKRLFDVASAAARKVNAEYIKMSAAAVGESRLSKQMNQLSP